MIESENVKYLDINLMKCMQISKKNYKALLRSIKKKLIFKFIKISYYKNVNSTLNDPYIQCKCKQNSE